MPWDKAQDIQLEAMQQAFEGLKKNITVMTAAKDYNLSVDELHTRRIALWAEQDDFIKKIREWVKGIKGGRVTVTVRDKEYDVPCLWIVDLPVKRNYRCQIRIARTIDWRIILIAMDALPQIVRTFNRNKRVFDVWPDYSDLDISGISQIQAMYEESKKYVEDERDTTI